MNSTTVLRRTVAGLASCKEKSLAPVWCAMAALLIGAAWLLPNHAQPWLSFHSEALMAVSLSVIAAVVLVRAGPLSFSALEAVLALTAALPMVQYAIGLIPFAGLAWMSSAYILGFLLAIVVGRQWQTLQPIYMGNMLFGAIFVGALVSVGLQLYQWMGLADDRGMFDIWVFGVAEGRPYANLAQPNLMATLHLWGLIACAWGLWRGYVGPKVCALAVFFLVFGIALTQSRSGFLGLCALAAAAWWWRGLWARRGAASYGLALIPLFFFFSQLIKWGSIALYLDDAGTMISRTMGEVRPALWSMMLEAALDRPWFGYGWNQALGAHIAFAERYPDLPALFVHAHNLILDLIVWVGIPLGLLLSAVLLLWFVAAARRIEEPSQLLYFCMVLTLGLHSMVELPYHYAFFLLPLGLAIGALSGQLRIWLLAPASRMAQILTCVVFAAATALMVQILDDYFRVETATFKLRMKLAGKPLGPTPPPDVTLLTQFRYVLDPALLEFSPELSQQDLHRMRDVTTAVLTFRNLTNLTLSLALNGHTQEARCWMAKANVLVPPRLRPLLTQNWEGFQAKFPQLQAVRWPPISEAEEICAPVRQSALGPYP